MALAQIGGVLIDALISERLAIDNDVTERPVEDAESITDHVNRKNDTLVLNGRVTSGGEAKRDALSQFSKSRELIDYIGKNVVSSAVIQSFRITDNAENADGFDFTMTLRVIRRARRSFTPLNINTASIVIPQVKSTTNSGQKGQSTLAVDVESIFAKIEETTARYRRERLLNIIPPVNPALQ